MLEMLSGHELRQGLANAALKRYAEELMLGEEIFRTVASTSFQPIRLETLKDWEWISRSSSLKRVTCNEERNHLAFAERFC
jgi:hypothetical protein